MRLYQIQYRPKGVDDAAWVALIAFPMDIGLAAKILPGLEEIVGPDHEIRLVDENHYD